MSDLNFKDVPLEHRKARVAQYIHKVTGGLPDDVIKAIVNYTWQTTYFESKLFGMPEDSEPMLNEPWHVKLCKDADLFEKFLTLRTRRTEPLTKDAPLYYQAGRWIYPCKGNDFGLDLSLKMIDADGEYMFKNHLPPTWNKGQICVTAVKTLNKMTTDKPTVYRSINIWIPNCKLNPQKPLQFCQTCV